MRVICDIEADSLTPTKIWCIVCKDIDNERIYHWDIQTSFQSFASFSRNVNLWVGHNFLGYDLWALNSLVPDVQINPRQVIDTLVVSRLRDFRMDGGHSLENWGERLGFKKHYFKDFSQYTPEMLAYCKQDVEVNYRVFKELESFIYDTSNREALRTEHDIAILCRRMHDNGFYFNREEATPIYEALQSELREISTKVSEQFPPRAKVIKLVVPRKTKAGTLHGGDFRWVTDGDLTPYSPEHPFHRIEWQEFNPASPLQVVERFNEFGWNPYVKTKGHVEAERDLKRLRREIHQTKMHIPVGKLTEMRKQEADLVEKLEHYNIYGWKINEDNLATLPNDAPEAAWLLIKWKMLDKRRQTLDEWFEAYNEQTHRIHGNFNGIGTWTHRFSHSNPNMGNVPSVDSKYNSTELKESAKHYGVKLRSLWTVPKGKRLVGVDAEGIQLRVLAHYMNDPEFTEALVNGDKDKGTDVHTLNAIKLGIGAHRRPNAKTFIYAWLLGAGLDKVAAILDTNRDGAAVANENFLNGYPGLREVKEVIIPKDVDNGYFVGLDGRKVPCESDHLMLAGYLQNGETIIMKRATLLWSAQLDKEKIPYKLVDYVHDEWQTETEDNDDLANYIASVQMNAIKQVGEELRLNCPLSGSKSIGYNWYETH